MPDTPSELAVNERYQQIIRCLHMYHVIINFPTPVNSTLSSNIYICIDVLNKVQANTYMKQRFLEKPAPVLKRERKKNLGLYHKYLSG